MDKLEHDREIINKELQSNKIEIKAITESAMDRIVMINMKDLTQITDEVDEISKRRFLDSLNYEDHNCERALTRLR